MRRALLALALVAASLAAVGAVAGADVYPIGTDHGLATNESIQQYEDAGVATANLTALDVGITVANDHAKAGIPGVRVDLNKVWVCVDYREDIPRTLQVGIPAAYASPRPGETESVTSDHHVSYRPAADGNYTQATIEFDGAARACWSFRTSAGWYFGGKDTIREFLNETTGISLPSLSGGDTAWQRLPADAWDNTTQVPLNVSTDATVQYDAAPGSDREWLSVPDCEDPSEQPVCQYESTNTTTNATVTLLSTQDSPPPVRYKPGTDAGAVFGGALADIQQAVGSFLDDVGAAFGGGG